MDTAKGGPTGTAGRPPPVSSMKLHRHLGISQMSTRHLARRIRETFATEPGSFQGVAETDETHLGGRKKDPASGRRLEGSGVAGKVALGGIPDRPPNQITATVLPNTKVRTSQDFVRFGVPPGAALCTDEATTYRGMPGLGHETVSPSVRGDLRGPTHTNGEGPFGATLKRGCVGPDHFMGANRFGRYVGELAGRHLRGAGATNPMEATASGFLGKRLRCVELRA